MACERFQRWLDGEGATPHPSTELLRHVEGCRECAAAHRAYRTALDAVAGTCEAPGAPDAAWMVARPRPRPATARPGWLAAAAVAGAAAVLFLSWPDRSPDPAPAPGIEAAGPVLTGAGAVVLAGDPGALPIPAPAPVRAGAAVRAGADRGRIEDRDTGVVDLAPGTRLAIGAWDAGATVLSLAEGRVDADVLPRLPGQGFEVRTPYATVRVHGTRFAVTHLPGVATVVDVASGEVVVESASGRNVATLTAGGSIRVGPEAVPTSIEAPLPEAAPVRVAASTATAPPGSARPAEAIRGVGVTSAGASAASAGASGASATSASSASSIPSGTPPAAAPPRVEDVLGQAGRLLAEGRDDEAVGLLAGTIGTTPGERARLLSMLGDAHRLAGRPGAALAAYDAAIDGWPGTPPEGLLVDRATLLAARPDRRTEASRAWERCLDLYPTGRFAPRALAELAAAAGRDGRPDRVEGLAARLLALAPETPDALRLFVEVGRRKLDTGDVAGAEAWFRARDGAPVPALAEAALVGRMRVRMQQGRWDDVRTLGAEHARRFPSGTRADEVARMLEGAR